MIPVHNLFPSGTVYPDSRLEGHQKLSLHFKGRYLPFRQILLCMNIKVINIEKSACHSSPESNYYTFFADEMRYTSGQLSLNTTLVQNQCTN